MKISLLMNFSVDKKNKQIIVEKEFAAPLSKVWSAWTESQLLDQWWAPKPWKAKTKKMDFKEGGSWLYAMVGPEGQEHWAKAEFKSVQPSKRFSAQDAFCDKDGNIDTTMPVGFWKVEFQKVSHSTVVSIEIKYDELADLEKIMETGFKEGFTAALENLDKLISQP
ncbi:MAG: SRPBCC domain-containing protein [Bacteroidota bacterium]